MKLIIVIVITYLLLLFGLSAQAANWVNVDAYKAGSVSAYNEESSCVKPCVNLGDVPPFDIFKIVESEVEEPIVDPIDGVIGTQKKTVYSVEVDSVKKTTYDAKVTEDQAKASARLAASERLKAADKSKVTTINALKELYFDDLILRGVK